MGDIIEGMDFEKVFKLLVEKFEKAGVDFALIGGFALHAAGYMRATNDIDFLADKDDMPKVKSIMSSLGYEILHESEDVSNFLSPLAPLGRVDFLHAHRKYAKAMLQRAVEKNILGHTVKAKVIIPEDLIGLKVQSSSNDPDRYHRDMADIEEVIKTKRVEMDMRLVKEYFDLLKRGPELQQILDRLNHA